jgi:response regulator RpfG family c-di-GMP phosphodiesterase
LRCAGAALVWHRCGAAIARRIGFPEPTAQAIRALDEHWCGLGHPDGLRGEAIPLLARVALLAQWLEMFHAGGGVVAALRVGGRRWG